jgi:hypothetical protein
MPWVAEAMFLQRHHFETAAPGRYHCEVIARLYVNFGAKPVHREPFEKRIACGTQTIKQQSFTIGRNEKIKQDLALRREQSGVDGAVGPNLLDIVCNQALQKGSRFRAGNGDDGTVVEAGDGHDGELNPALAIAKARA